MIDKNVAFSTKQNKKQNNHYMNSHKAIVMNFANEE
jgi:hypothetical protein